MGKSAINQVLVSPRPEVLLISPTLVQVRTWTCSPLNRALEMRRSALPATHPDIAATYHGIASVHEKLGNHSKARLSLEEAVEIGEHSLGHHHPQIQLYQQALNRLRKSV